jgi:Cu+-exporting ATPase
MPVPQTLESRALPGRGLQGSVDGQVVWLGSTRLLHEKDLSAGPLAQEAKRLEGAGRTVS